MVHDNQVSTDCKKKNWFVSAKKTCSARDQPKTKRRLPSYSINLFLTEVAIILHKFFVTLWIVIVREIFRRRFPSGGPIAVSLLCDVCFAVIAETKWLLRHPIMQSELNKYDGVSKRCHLVSGDRSIVLPRDGNPNQLHPQVIRICTAHSVLGVLSALNVVWNVHFAYYSCTGWLPKGIYRVLIAQTPTSFIYIFLTIRLIFSTCSISHY